MREFARRREKNKYSNLILANTRILLRRVSTLCVISKVLLTHTRSKKDWNFLLSSKMYNMSWSSNSTRLSQLIYIHERVAMWRQWNICMRNRQHLPPQDYDETVICIFLPCAIFHRFIFRAKKKRKRRRKLEWEVQRITNNHSKSVVATTF